MSYIGVSSPCGSMSKPCEPCVIRCLRVSREGCEHSVSWCEHLAADLALDRRCTVRCFRTAQPHDSTAHSTDDILVLVCVCVKYIECVGCGTPKAGRGPGLRARRVSLSKKYSYITCVRTRLARLGAWFGCAHGCARAWRVPRPRVGFARFSGWMWAGLGTSPQPAVVSIIHSPSSSP